VRYGVKKLVSEALKLLGGGQGERKNHIRVYPPDDRKREEITKSKGHEGSTFTKNRRRNKGPVWYWGDNDWTGGKKIKVACAKVKAAGVKKKNPGGPRAGEKKQSSGNKGKVQKWQNERKNPRKVWG